MEPLNTLEKLGIEDAKMLEDTYEKALRYEDLCR